MIIKIEKKGKNRLKLPVALRNRIAEYISRNYEFPCEMQTEACIKRTVCSVAENAYMAPAATVGALTLEDALNAVDTGFSEALLQLIDKTGKKDSEIYKKANISKQHFSKIRNNPDYKPTKPTAIALALALELSLEDTKDLIGRAGYALTNSSKFDLIIRYFIEHGNYNVVEINIALYEFDQALLGA